MNASFALRLLALMEERCLSRSDLKRVFKSTTVHSWISGRSIPSGENLTKLAAILKAPPDFVNIAPPPPRPIHVSPWTNYTTTSTDVINRRKSFAERLTEIMDDLGVSVSDLLEKGFIGSSVYAWLSGRYTPSAKHRAKLAAALAVELEQFADIPSQSYAEIAEGAPHREFALRLRSVLQERGLVPFDLGRLITMSTAQNTPVYSWVNGTGLPDFAHRLRICAALEVSYPVLFTETPIHKPVFRVPRKQVPTKLKICEWCKERPIPYAGQSLSIYLNKRTCSDECFRAMCSTRFGARRAHRYPPLAVVQQILAEAGITNAAQFRAWKKRPANVPSQLAEHYGSYANVFGKPPKKRGQKYLSLADARKALSTADIKSWTQYKTWLDRPQNLPSATLVPRIYGSFEVLLQGYKAHGARNSSGCVGVNRKGLGWVARITISGDRIYLGTFDTFAKAKKARLMAERKVAEARLLRIAKTRGLDTSPKLTPEQIIQAAPAATLRITDDTTEEELSDIIRGAEVA